MKTSKRKVLLGLIVSILTILSSMSYAATAFVVDIDGLNEPISEIQSFSIWLNVDGEFAISNLNTGNAIPEGLALGWDIQNDVVIDDKRGQVLKLGGLDQDGAFMLNHNELSNGVIFTFEYVGNILGVTDVFQFSDRTGTNKVEDLKLTYDLSPTGLHIRAVPIPAAIYLFGAGLIGVIGLRRKSGR